MQRSLKALVVAYHFPPGAAIGGVRPYQIARHLPEFGIDPWILTVDPRHAEQADAAFVPQGIEPARVMRTTVDSTLRDHLFRLWQRTLMPSRNAVPAESRPTGGPPAPSRWRPAQDWVLSWLAYTDPLIGWYRPGLRRAEEIVREVPFDVVLSTSPPRVAALIACELSRRHRIPWLMDLRDPWQLKRWEPTSRLVARHRDRLFSRCVSVARRIVHNTERLRLDTCAVRPDAAQKTCYIPNGFEPEWAEVLDPSERAFRIGYYGNIMGRRSCAVFLDGFRTWINASSAKPPSVSVRFVGWGFERVGAEIAQRDLGAFVTVLPAVPRTQVRQLIRDDFVLLSFANDQPLQVPGKTYDYLATGRRILAITEHDGATADVLQPVPECSIAERPEEVAAALEAFHRAFLAGASARVERPRFFEEASYRSRAARFAELIRSVAGA